MSHYLLSAIRLDESGHRVTHVQWVRLDSPNPLHYHPTEANVLDVVNALNCGDHVYFFNEESHREHSVGPKFHVVVYPGGTEGIVLDGFELTDLPIF